MNSMIEQMDYTEEVGEKKSARAWLNASPARNAKIGGESVRRWKNVSTNFLFFFF